ncbi:RagB/SusD family nutrient uptake outer membrane protein [Algivirga pacifica]|uniref:SusD/RagB family nutrient-binding outer membrane lipoprotein n=1 Tax=Algivirga pacifica TaxID=1162670 RepID=A0ABP9D7N9_9BACT
MKNIIKKYMLPAAVVASLLPACTDDFQEINTDDYAVTEELLEGDFQFAMVSFPQLTRSIYFNYDESNWKWQIVQNLNADVFSGYLAPPTPFRGNSNDTHYDFGWNGWAFNVAYENIMGPAYSLEQAKEKISPKLYAVGLILKVAGMHRVTDAYGPIPYTQYGEAGATYDSQEAVYDAFFSELNEAIAALEADQDPLQAFSANDDFFQGDFAAWKKFANSLKLRLAMRISNVAPAKAKQYAEQAIASGVFVDGDVAQVSGGVINNPLGEVSQVWGDTRMNAAIGSYLLGLNDPRLSIYFTPAAEGSGAVGEYVGIRHGAELPDKGSGTYVNYSNVNPGFSGKDSPLRVMNAAEVYFLRAEAAVKGWNAGGSAQELYEAGITASFNQLGAVGASEYIADATSMPAAYADPQNEAYDIASPSMVTVAWSDEASAEEKLEKIITQKWIANFPEGMEAWSEIRRTGYPKLFPVAHNKSGGKVDTEKGALRLPYPPEEAENNAAAYQAGVSALGGDDHAGTALWWDVD